MSQNHEKNEGSTFKQKLTIIIQKNSTILLGLLALIVIVVIGLLIYNSIQLKSLEKETQQIEAIQDNYEKISLLTDEGEIEKARSSLLTDLDTLINSSSKNYALQRGLFIRANLYYNNNELKKSVDDFKLLAKTFPNSYLAAISLVNAGTALEDQNKTDDAIEVYKMVIDKYSKTSPETANIYFSIGRLFEENGDFKAAKEEYNTLLDNFPDSNWTNLARSRIIFLESK
ncbi:MAG: tetratricopeptide repeat protein [Spirochaetaceae bacterium]|nr:tetratricopeptide repeat protein [Spirochaetaceae bacterium]